MKTDLPIGEVLPSLIDALRDNDEVVLQAPPGAGKTTIVPLALTPEDWLGYNRILVLEPRRLAARAAAERMADLVGEKPGQTIGYRMRFDTRVSQYTKVEVITEGVLTRMLIDDPTLPGVGMVIFDEFHERSLEADTALALCLQAREIFREEPLKLLVMSATLDMTSVASLLDAPTITSEGRSYPVEVIHGKASAPRERIADRMTEELARIARQHPDAGILAFLPGQGEISQVERQLGGKLKGFSIRPLYGALSPEAQRAAIRGGERTIVLATNIAETSLTIEGINVVVDSGLERVPRFDAGAGMSRLTTVRISQASATQRAGRAGRLGPGNCYRLWSASQQDGMAPHAAPEILDADLAPLALTLAGWGISTPEELTWLTPPPAGAWAQARSLLKNLGALADVSANQLTIHGERMNQVAAHPRLAHMMIAGAGIGATRTATQLAALLSERDPLDSTMMQDRLDILEGSRNCPPRLRGWLSRTQSLVKQYAGQVPSPDIHQVVPRKYQLGYLLACGFPDRIARRRHSGGYQLANGRSAKLGDDKRKSPGWLAVAEVSGTSRSAPDVIRSAAPLDDVLFESALQDLVTDAQVVEWSNRENRFIAERRRQIGELVLSRQPLPELPAGAAAEAIIMMLKREGLEKLNWTREARAYQSRVQFARTADAALPDLSDDNLLATLETWLAPFLDGVTTPKHLAKLKVLDLLRNQLDWPTQQRVESLVPERVEVPSGRSVVIDYGQEPPVLPVKLQEMFGADASPTIVDGQQPLVVHLLSPAGRPLAVTSDLPYFWANAYPSVRKEMRGRYPKHPWPEDPVTATPTRHTKKHQKP